jgi:hypothetical protein
VAPLLPGASGDASARGRWIDRILGIALGIVLGLGVLVYFVFVHSEGTIDAPKVNEGGAGSTVPAPSEEPAREAETPPTREHRKKPKPVPVVKVIGGAPPEEAGPEQLQFTEGEKVRFVIETAEPFAFEIKGLGISRSIESTSTIAFKANKAGQFPVIASATLIAVADLLIRPRR